MVRNFFFSVYNGVEDRIQDLLHTTQTPHYLTKPSGLMVRSLGSIEVVCSIRGSNVNKQIKYY
jgi:hypothetical protein